MALGGAGGFNRKIRKLSNRQAGGGMQSNKRFNNKIDGLKQGRRDFRANRDAGNATGKENVLYGGGTGVGDITPPELDLGGGAADQTGTGIGDITPPELDLGDGGGEQEMGPDGRPRFKKRAARLRRMRDSGKLGPNKFKNRMGKLRGARDEYRAGQEGDEGLDIEGDGNMDPDGVVEPGGDKGATEDGVTESLFPGQDSFLPENYEGSPMYKFQQQEGQKAMDRLYASRGLNKSGAEIEGNIKFMNQLGAQESQRQQQIAQQEADRYERMTGRESDRLERRDDAGWGRARDMMGFGERAINNIAGLKKGRKKAKANWLANNYARAFGGGGASAGPRPNFTPPFGGPPNMDFINGTGAVGNSAGNSNWYDDIGSIISSLF